MKDWRVGLLLAGSTASLWATLPIAAKLALQGVDPFTLTWTRFAFAAIVTTLWLAWRGRLSVYRTVTRRVWLWLAGASVALIANYLLYLVGLNYTTPANAQVLIQVAPLLMGLGGLVLFSERFSRGQWIGLAVLLLGMGSFFADQLVSLFSNAGSYVFGVVIILVSAAAWAVYALIQKHVGNRLDSQAILLVVYLSGTVVLAPMSTYSTLFQLNLSAGLAVLYCCLNTVLAYGAFAAAVQVWQSSRVSAVLTLAPLGTLLCVQVIAALGLGWLEPEQVSVVGWLGAIGVVVGSMTISLAGRKKAV